MSTKNGKESAYATEGRRGLTKREMFAAMALQGLLADPTVSTEGAVEMAVRAADHLLARLEE